GIEPVGRDREEKLVVRLVGTDKGLIINKSNFDVISGLYGTDEDDWIGREIHLRVGPSKMNGTPSIIANAPPLTKATRPRPEAAPSDDDVPFPGDEDAAVE